MATKTTKKTTKKTVARTAPRNTTAREQIRECIAEHDILRLHVTIITVLSLVVCALVAALILVLK